MAMQHRFRAVVLDLDGTLVETAPDLCAALNHTLGRMDLPPVDLADVRHMIGDGARALLRRGLEASGVAPPDDVLETSFQTLLAYYNAHIADHSYPFDGIVELLSAWKTDGVKLGVCTNKMIGSTERLLAALELSRHFDAVFGGDSLPVRKPDRRHLLAVLDALAVPPADAVMVGDSANDVATARNAGVPVVVVSFGYTPVPAAELGADAVIDHFDELPAALAGLGSA